ncbi:MAG: phage tail family protein, partial [Alphaproteobacteria bacterium]|nr:phage tail family protein [Alphaproteobacteria bacterium]
MQKLRFVNGNGVELDLTSGHYGITNWSGFSNADLTIQGQQVPFQDGEVFLDALYNPRELSVTLAINDNNNLALRYELKRELISVMNAKLGEGYLYYKNDFTEKRIKVIPQLPIFENKNSNDSGTLKASLSWTAPEVYWEDVEESAVNMGSFTEYTVKNEGDIPCQIKMEVANWNTPNFAVRNGRQRIALKNINDCDKIFINTNMGEKSVIKEEEAWRVSGFGGHITGITYSEPLGLFVAVGYGGTILTSLDGVTWSNRISGVSVDLNGITYSEPLGLFVAVGDSGTILTSPSGVTWSSQTSGVSAILTGITYSEPLGLFVVVGNSGTILTSSDGVTWSNRISGVSASLYGIVYSEPLGLFVVVGNSGTILTSPDGVTWSSRTSGVVSVVLRDITYSESLGLFVVVGYGGTILTSSDGVTWSSRTSGVSAILTGITYSKPLGLFVVVGISGRILTSPDGVTWSSQTSGVSAILTGITYSEPLGLFVVVGN